jgi:hypothetical protein
VEKQSRFEPCPYIECDCDGNHPIGYEPHWKQQPEALRWADALMRDVGSQLVNRKQAAAELRRLHEENRKLKTVMVAAAEEIAKHWDAHCDAEGYGPANLMHRLEAGIPSEYGYTAGAFAELNAINARQPL